MQYFFIEEFLYLACVTLTKVSIILLYLRIIPSSISPRFRIICLILIGLLLANMVSFIVALGFQCRPVSYSWTQWTGETQGSCMNLQAQVYSSSATNITFDLIVFALPIPKLLGLQVRDTRKKIMVVLTFLVGLLGTICSVVRLAYLTQWGNTTNATMHYNNIAIWSAVEGGVGVICACMPAIAGPILHFMRQFIGSEIFTRSRSKFASAMDSKGSKGVHRVPSSAGPSSLADSYVDRNGGISKTVESRMYNIPNDSHSDDDVELVSREGLAGEQGKRTSKPAKGFGHEYAGSWR